MLGKTKTGVKKTGAKVGTFGSFAKKSSNVLCGVCLDGDMACANCGGVGCEMCKRSGIDAPGKRLMMCMDCTGKQVCYHGQSRKSCKVCNGPCKHGKKMSSCKLCSPKMRCFHDRRLSSCKICLGKWACKHGKQQTTCGVCKWLCVHNKSRLSCAKCFKVTCKHGKKKQSCLVCFLR